MLKRIQPQPQAETLSVHYHEQPETVNLPRKLQILTVAFLFISKQARIQMIREEEKPWFSAIDLVTTLCNTNNTKETKSVMKKIPPNITSRYVERHLKGKRDTVEPTVNYDGAIMLVDAIFEINNRHAQHRDKIVATFDQCTRIAPTIEIFPGGNIRVLYAWPEPLLSLMDVVPVVCNKVNDPQQTRFATETLESIFVDFPEVLEQQIEYFQFLGQGQKDTPCGNLKTTLEIIMHLAIKSTETLQRTAVETLTQFFAGVIKDQSLYDTHSAEILSLKSNISQERVQDIESKPKGYEVDNASSSDMKLEGNEHPNEDESYRSIIKITDTIEQICKLRLKERSTNGKNGFIYLVQPAYAKDNVFKVGMTICRKSKNSRYPSRVLSYGKKARVFLCQEVSKTNVKAIENEIIKRFTANFTKVEGNEWFEGDVNAMVQIINHVIQQHA